MNATAALTAVQSTETFGLPAEVPHLIAKLRLVSPEVLATIMHKDQDLTA
jgi:hypothetical protein